MSLPEPKITVVGLGPGSPDLISQGARARLLGGNPVYFRTTVHPLISELIKEIPGKVNSFDHVYQEETDFSTVYDRIVAELLSAASNGPIVYAVPGHPFVAETTVTNLVAKAKELGTNLEVVPSMSGLEAMLAELQIDPTDGLVICDALDMPSALSTETALLVTQVYSQMAASQLKLRLLEDYDAEHLVTLVKAAGVPKEARQESIPLYRLDQISWIDHLTSLYVPKVANLQEVQTPFSLLPLVKVMERLRGDGGCAWDQKQTHETLKPYLIEEAYEVVEAVDTQGDLELMEELGDVLLQVVFHAQIAAERNAFDADDIVKTLVEKLIRRHPHVFGDTVANTPEEVSRNWDKIKRQEKAAKGDQPRSLLDGVPKGLPALMTAYELQSKAAKAGFDWPDAVGAFAKVTEEIKEFGEALSAQGEEEQASEFGDILFALVNVARHLKIEPEMALITACQRFKDRFGYIEKEAHRQGLSLADMTLQQMDELWDQAKVLENR